MPVQIVQQSQSTQVRSAPPVKNGQTDDFSRILVRARNSAQPEQRLSSPSSPPRHVPAISTDASDWQKYRDEQLLSNPGGENYFIPSAAQSEGSGVIDNLGKDVSDVVDNIGNFFHNLLFGAETHYRDEQGEVQTSQNRGLVGSLVDLVCDVGSALSFGAWRPDGEAAPEGFQERASFVFDKLKEAVADDVVAGVGGSVNHMGEDLLLAGWNLVEMVPDATISNVDAAEKVVSNVFDNGQVVIDYLTDVLPGAEAWLRIHATDLNDNQVPVFYNLTTPENFTGDTRWEQVSNTPLRKALETVGSLLADGAMLMLLGQLPSTSQDHH
ncbi:hypothetical protein [Desulfuromonas acetoxidans]|uniref:hypothetical protein n=1 Tax=Desulfuromonas acetoxidans TaxID=891 RepID=UPI00292FE7FD|nr:hypothetical protein [Desulfuromonas acetoxidans]